MTAPTVDRTTERRLGIATRCEFATPGPWYTTEVEEGEGNVCITHAHHDLYRVESNVVVTDQRPGATTATVNFPEVNVGCFLGERADAEFIACARADVEWLLDRLKDSDAALLAARREVEALRAAATDCADDLEAELRNRYHYPDVHPAMQGKYERDMESVLAVRAALAATPEEPTKTPCKRCHGKGSVPVGTMRVACSDCEGSGAAATEEEK